MTSEAPASSHAEPEPPGHPGGGAGSASPQRWLGLAGLGMGIFMFTLDGSIVNVALPTLIEVFGTTFATVQWVVLAYLLVATALVMGAARLGDQLGKRRIYLSGMAIFTLGSLLCGIASSVWWLIACRALQGLGAVFVTALGAAIVAETFPANERGRALGTIGSCVLLGVALGPSLGGLIIGYWNWRWLFLVNIPFGLLAMLLILRYVPRTRGRRTGAQFDWPGNLLAAAALVSFALALNWGQASGFSSPRVVALLIATLLCAVAFVFVERRSPNPVLDLKLLANRPFASGLLMGNLVFVVLGGVTFLLPFFLGVIAKFPPAKMGLLLAVSPVLGGILAPFGGTLADRLGARRIALLGLVSVCCGCVMLATLNANVSAWGFALRIAPIGLGLGLFNAANNSSVLNAVDRHHLGAASGLLSLMRTLGQSTGVPLLGALFSVVALHHSGGADHAALMTLPTQSLLAGIQWALLAAAAIALIALIIGLRTQPKERELKRRT